jgi:hypothetical protein
MYEWWGATDLSSAWMEKTAPHWRRLGVGLFALYAAVLVFVAVWRAMTRRSRDPMKPLFTCLLDTVLEIPYLLKLGPWGQENSIMQAMERAMNETKLTDFGLEDPNDSGTWKTIRTPKKTGERRKSSVAPDWKDPYGFVERYETSRTEGLVKVNGIYSPIGYLLSYRTIHRRMVTRLKHVEYMKNHPNIQRIPVEKPVFVIGFPRTGTTFLHEMLSVHAGVKTHYTWEQYDHVPGTNSESSTDLRRDRENRYQTNKRVFDQQMRLVGDAIQSIHRIGYDEPEECTTPCAFELPYAIGALPLYIMAAQEVVPLGCGRAFDFYKEYLQMLTWQATGEVNELQIGAKTFKPVSSEEGANIDRAMQESPDALGSDKRWMLKCPFHLPYLDELFETFPDATVVWTHRDPVECIGSACSLYYTLAAMALEAHEIDKKAIGRAVVEYTQLSLDKAHATLEKLRTRRLEASTKNSQSSTSSPAPKRGLKMGEARVKGAQREGEGHVIHVRYQDNVKDPRGTVEGILREVGLIHGDGEAASYQQSLDRYLARNKAANEKNKSKTGGHGHKYSLAEYGLDEEEVRSVFKAYTDKYRLCEK